MTKFIKINFDWPLVRNCCRSTVRKDFIESEPSGEFKRKLVVAEHSPIRELTVMWRWDNIPYWLSTEWSRHKFEKYITSQRNDRQKEYDRNGARQDAPVDFIGSADVQSRIDSFRKRLCFCATKEARALAVDFKMKLYETYPEVSLALVPHCIYRGGCPEIKNCGHFARFMADWSFGGKFPFWSLDGELPFVPPVFDIQKRYEAYHSYLSRNTND